MASPIQKSTSISILVATAFFMENLDGTVIATALPDMGKSFHANPVDLNIGMTAYLLMLAVFIPISGWVADRVGARTVLFQPSRFLRRPPFFADSAQGSGRLQGRA